MSGCAENIRRVKLEIDCTKLLHNFAAVQKKVESCQILSVLKANAYGTGADRMGPLAVKAGASRIGVADLAEALAMQKAVQQQVPVQILGVVTPDELPVAVENNVVIPVDGLAMAQAVSAEAVRQQKSATVHLILDTGMGRFGWLAGAVADEIKAAAQLPNLQIEGLYSHFPCAGTPGEAGTLAQIELFKQQLEELQKAGVTFRYRHIAASDGILCQTPSHQEPFNLVRLGLCWYGVCRNPGEEDINLQPALRLTTVVGAVRELPAGFTVGYNRTVKLQRKTKVATICAGYADGLPLALSNTGRVLINGCSCPVLGRVSMDYTMVDVSNVPGEVKWGTPVTLWGQDGNEYLGIAEYAQHKNTHIHDILCALGCRVQRVYC
ncbi:MAG: alanine racemase [Lentisphaerae bacterium]|nr:alanine racemase [Lentisphaerota bacterium]